MLLSLLDVYLWRVVRVYLFRSLFVLLIEDIRLFAFHLFSDKLRIVDRLQNVNDRQSLERAGYELKQIKAGTYHNFFSFFFFADCMAQRLCCPGNRL